MVFKYLKKIEKKRFNTLIPLGVWIVLIQHRCWREDAEECKKKRDCKNNGISNEN